MEVIYKCGDSITIPDGCKAIVKYGCVVFEKGQEFKDGDILVSVGNGKRYNAFIYKSTDKGGFHSYYVGLDVYNQISVSDSPSNRWGGSSLSYATEEEKQLLFDKMKKQGYKWNAEEKKVEETRWRPMVNEFYYFITATGMIGSEKNREDLLFTSNERYNFFNQFRTHEQATEARNRIKEALENYHYEIGA